MKFENIPGSMRTPFEKAATGKSKSFALKAKCLECSCFQRDEVTLCTVKTCPLWIYRPYQNARVAHRTLMVSSLGDQDAKIGIANESLSKRQPRAKKARKV